MLIRGTELTALDQKTAVEKFKRDPGTGPVAAWLENTMFKVNGKRRLDSRARYCYPCKPFDMFNQGGK